MMVKTIFWATICFWGSFIALFPFISIYISKSAFESPPLNEFIYNNSNIILSVGTLLLISLLAILQAHVSNRSLEAREKTNRKTQVQMKLAEFRHDWITNLRDQASEFSALVHDAKDLEQILRMRSLATKISLCFDPNQDDFGRVVSMINDFIKYRAFGDDSMASKPAEFEVGIARILDREWGIMKAELEMAQASSEKPP